MCSFTASWPRLDRARSPAMALTDQETRNRDHVLALYSNVLDPHDRTRLA